MSKMTTKAVGYRPTKVSGSGILYRRIHLTCSQKTDG